MAGLDGERFTTRALIAAHFERQVSEQRENVWRGAAKSARWQLTAPLGTVNGQMIARPDSRCRPARQAGNRIESCGFVTHTRCTMERVNKKNFTKKDKKALNKNPNSQVLLSGERPRENFKNKKTKTRTRTGEKNHERKAQGRPGHGGAALAQTTPSSTLINAPSICPGAASFPQRTEFHCVSFLPECFCCSPFLFLSSAKFSYFFFIF